MNLAGVRFSPTKQELINHYLKNKILGKTWLVDDSISEIDICNYDPMFLPCKFSHLQDPLSSSIIFSSVCV